MHHLQDSTETQRLLDQASRGDRDAFVGLFTRHRDELRRAVVLRLDPRLQPRVDPSDVLQETQIDALRRLDDYLARRPMPVRIWLRKTALERLIKVYEFHLKAARRTITREVRLPDVTSVELARRMPTGPATPSEQMIAAERMGQVQQALAELDYVDREILIMRYIERLSNAEIATTLDLTPAAVSKRHGRALLRLQSRLRDARHE